MVITTMRALAGSLAAFFLIIELAFLGANLIKIAQGGWFPLVIGAVVYTILSTWKAGRALLASRLRERSIRFNSSFRTSRSDLHSEWPEPRFS